MATVQITPKQEEALLYLAQGYSQKKVAELIEVTPQTINTWVKNPSFKALIEKHRNRLNERYLDELVRLRILSLHQLTEILENGKPLEKLHATRIILATIDNSLRG